MDKLIPQGYRKFVGGVLLIIIGGVCQALTLNNPEIWANASAFVSPKTLLYVGAGFVAGGNLADKLPFLKPK